MSLEKREFDSSYWNELDTIEKFYYEGMLLADGFVHGSKVCIDLAIKDYDWLMHYKHNLGIDTKIHIREQYPARNSVSASVTKGCKEWVEDLAKYGVVPRKTGRESLPYELCSTEKEVAALTLGWFDGDCSIYDYNERTNVSILGNHHVCGQIIEQIKKYVDIDATKMCQDKRTKDIWTTKYSRVEDLVELYNWLYNLNPELSNCYLMRKKFRWDEFMLKTVM